MMTKALLTGNLISLAAAFFTARSCWARDNLHIYMDQVYQCLLLALASVFFNSYAGIISLLACALRNYLAARDRLDKKAVTLCLLLILIPGLIVNNRGYIGWIVILANVIYSLGMYICRSELSIKLNMVLDLSMWMVYEALILDIPSFFSDLAALVVALAAITRILRERKQGRS